MSSHYNFPISGPEATRQLLTRLGLSPPVGDMPYLINCLICDGVDSARVYDADPAWCYCTRCDFAGDMIELFRQALMIPESKVFTEFEKLNTDWRICRYHREARAADNQIRENFQKAWDSLKTKLDTRRDRLRSFTADMFLPCHRQSWDVMFKASVMLGQPRSRKKTSLEELIATEPKPCRVQKLGKEDIWRTPLLLRTGDLPGRFSGVLFLEKGRKETAQLYQQQYLKNETPGIGLLSAIVASRAPQSVGRFVCTDLPTGLQMAAGYYAELGTTAPIAIQNRPVAKHKQLITRLGLPSLIYVGTDPLLTIKAAAETNSLVSLTQPPVLARYERYPKVTQILADMRNSATSWQRALAFYLSQNMHLSLSEVRSKIGNLI